MTTKRGFAALDPAERRALASKGGTTAHRKGVAHEFTPDEARIAGSKGGHAVSQNREYMAEIGRRGGFARSRSKQASDTE